MRYKGSPSGGAVEQSETEGGTSAVSDSGKPPYRLTAFGTSPSRGRLDGRGTKAPPQGEALVRAKLVGAGVPDGPFPRTKNKEMYIRLKVYISLFIICRLLAVIYLTGRSFSFWLRRPWRSLRRQTG